MRFLALLLLATLLPLMADNKQKLFELYQRGEYVNACNLGFRGLTYFQNDEAYISLYAFSCLKADMIDRLSAPIGALNQTKEARANAAYFAVIQMQKKLLMQALWDNQPIKNLSFPTSEYLLSKIFDLYLKNPQPDQSIKVYTDPLNNRLSYKLYTTVSNGRKSIAVDEYYDKILTMHHVY